MNLEAAVLDALVPRSRTETARTWITGGFSALQVLERLPKSIQEQLHEGAGLPQERRRAALSTVVEALFTQIDAGRVKRGRTRVRTSMVDVYRLAHWRGRG